MSKVYTVAELLRAGVARTSVERVATGTPIDALARAAAAQRGLPVVVLTDRPQEWLSLAPAPGGSEALANVLEFGPGEAGACGEVVDGLARRGRRFAAIADIDYRDDHLVAETIHAMMRVHWQCRVIVREHRQDWQGRRGVLSLAEVRCRSLDDRLTGCLFGTIGADGELACEMPQPGWELADA